MTAKFDIQKAYYLLRKIRRTEEKIVELYDSDKIKSPVHLSIGQEAIAVGVSMALHEDDIVYSNYRGHAHYIAKDGDLNGMWAELYGKETGQSAGKAGSMHLMDCERHFMPASAIVASAVSNAVGHALAVKMKGEQKTVVCFHGEGAADEGVFWESLNFAALKNLPILFVCENNNYAIYSEQKRRMKLQNIAEKAISFGVQADSYSGQETECVFEVVGAALKQVRQGTGPQLLEFCTYRWLDHVGPGNDHEKGYRNRTDLENAMNNDEIDRVAEKLGAEVSQELDARIEAELDSAVASAEQSNFPTAEAMMKYVYAE